MISFLRNLRKMLFRFSEKSKEHIFTLRIVLICFAIQGGSMIFVVVSESLQWNKVIKETYYGFIRKRHLFIDVEIRKGFSQSKTIV